MPSTAVTRWLQRERRQSLAAAFFFGLAALAGGAVALALISCLVFIAARTAAFLLFPTADSTTIWSITIAALATLLICADSIRAQRDDMSIFPSWLMREHIHIGPWMIRDGCRQLSRARGLAALDIESCAAFLAFLGGKSRAFSMEEARREFPGLEWSSLAAQLRLIDGVLILGEDASRIGLTTALRLTLRQLLVNENRPPDIEEESQPGSAVEPASLTPSEILGVASNATLGEIKLAYRARIKECHPDRFAGMDTESRRQAEEWTKSLNAAYDSLTRQRSRRGR